MKRIWKEVIVLKKSSHEIVLENRKKLVEDIIENYERSLDKKMELKTDCNKLRKNQTTAHSRVRSR